MTKGTLEKALDINLNAAIYGTIAEIGAGQEIANWFFRAGGAAGTIAKTMSAYDMTFSDEIYGRSSRYVSRQRLEAMLEHEYNIVCERLNEKRGASSTFFVLADTVKARGYRDTTSECQGWMGIRFQAEPGAAANDLWLHVRLLDDTNAEQAAALGVLGVNLLDAAFHWRDSLDLLLPRLMDGLDRRRMEIDVVRCRGPVFSSSSFEDRVCALELVEQGLSDAVLFGPDGSIQQPADVFYGKPVMLKRGSFDPVTLLHLDMLKQGVQSFQAEWGEQAQGCIEVMELTMKNLLTGEGNLQKDDFLARADVLQALGKHVLVSKYARFFRLGEYVTRHTKGRIGMVLGLNLFQELFDEKWYDELPGGLLESLGRMLHHGLKLYVYPSLCPETGRMITAREAKVTPTQQSLLQYLLEIGHVREIASGDARVMRHSSYEVREMWLQQNSLWRELVPAAVLQHSRWTAPRVS